MGRLPNDAVMHVTAVLPPSVSFPSAVHFAGTDKGQGALELQWRRCLPGACVAEAAVKEDGLWRWRWRWRWR